MEFFQFDADYLDKLRAGDAVVEQHFVSYFEQLLRIKLRARMLPPETVEELRQETFSRVLAALRNQNGVRQPERFGAFVNSVCNNVLLEFYRSSSRAQPLEPHHLEVAEPAKVLNVEDTVVTQEQFAHVRLILESLPARDRNLLRAIFLEEKDKDEVCRAFRCNREYLRVLLHRAKDRFRTVYAAQHTPAPVKAMGKRNA